MSNDPQPAKLTPAMEKYILHWGEMGSRWGVNRSVAQIHALLYLAGRGMHAEEISSILSIARSNVSTSLKELMSWELVTVTHVLGDRRDHFVAKQDLWDILLTVVAQRKRREVDPTLTVLRACKLEIAQDTDTPPDVAARMEAMLEFLESLTGWYEQIVKLPRTTLVKLLRMGSRISKFVGM